MAGQPVALPLENKNRHDGETIVGLNEEMLGQQQSLGVREVDARIVERGAVIAGGAFAVLEGEGVISAVPFEILMADTDGVAIAVGNVVPTGRAPATGIPLSLTTGRTVPPFATE